MATSKIPTGVLLLAGLIGAAIFVRKVYQTFNMEVVSTGALLILLLMAITAISSNYKWRRRCRECGRYH